MNISEARHAPTFRQEAIDAQRENCSGRLVGTPVPLRVFTAIAASFAIA